jgi:hypothetical protein
MFFQPKKYTSALFLCAQRLLGSLLVETKSTRDPLGPISFQKHLPMREALGIGDPKACRTDIVGWVLETEGRRMGGGWAIHAIRQTSFVQALS